MFNLRVTTAFTAATLAEGKTSGIIGGGRGVRGSSKVLGGSSSASKGSSSAAAALQSVSSWSSSGWNYVIVVYMCMLFD